MIHSTPVASGHVQCAVFDADGTLWDFNLSEELVHRTVRDRTASEAGLPAYNAALQSFGLPAGRDIHAAAAVSQSAWSSDHYFRYGREHGLDEVAVSLRIWPMYNWLYVGRTPASLAAQAQQWMREEDHQARVFSGVRRLVADLRGRGFRLRVVSAGVHEFVQAGAVEVGFAPSEVQGLALEVRDGVLTDRVVQPIPFKQGKATLARAMCEGDPMYAFGDSVATGDAAMLAAAAHPVAVRPSGRHLEAARQQGWLVWERPEE